MHYSKEAGCGSFIRGRNWGGALLGDTQVIDPGPLTLPASLRSRGGAERTRSASVGGGHATRGGWVSLVLNPSYSSDATLFAGRPRSEAAMSPRASASMIRRAMRVACCRPRLIRTTMPSCFSGIMPIWVEVLLRPPFLSTEGKVARLFSRGGAMAR
jgi:hypothetical protein